MWYCQCNARERKWWLTFITIFISRGIWRYKYKIRNWPIYKYMLKIKITGWRYLKKILYILHLMSPIRISTVQTNTVVSILLQSVTLLIYINSFKKQATWHANSINIIAYIIKYIKFHIEQITLNKQNKI